MLPLALLGWKREARPTPDVSRPVQSVEAEPSPLLEAIRVYLDHAA